MQIQASNSFHANLALAAGTAVSITAETMEQLAATVAKLTGTASAAAALPGGITKVQKAEAAPEGQKPEAKEQQGNDATTGAPASVQPAASGSEAAGNFTYDDVRARVLALAKVSRETAQQTLAQFKTVAGAPVDHGNKLQLPDYPAFIVAADAKLAGVGK